MGIFNSRCRLIIKVWRIHDCKLKKYANILGRYFLFAGNNFIFNKNIKLMSVMKKVPIINIVLLLFKGFYVYVASGKHIIINSCMPLRMIGSK